MAGPAATGLTSVLSALSGSLSSLSPLQTLALGQHLSSSNYAKALQILNNMLVNPGGAGMYVSALSIIPNLPPQVMTYVSAALAQPTAFTSSIEQAVAALQQVFSSESALQQAGL